MHRNSPALADAADLLSDQLLAHLRRLTQLIRPHAAVLDQKYDRKLKKLGFGLREREALAGITPGAAVRTRGFVKRPALFFQRLAENGCLLAKLEVAPADVSAALHAYDELLQPLLGKLSPQESANLSWVREQFHFCVLLTLNNSYYEVREAEARTLFKLFRIELDAEDACTLFDRFIEQMLKLSGAAAGKLYVRSRETGEWSIRASSTAGDNGPVRRAPAEVLDGPAYIEKNQRRKLLFAANWADEFASCWSLPLSRGDSPAVLQLGFSKPIAYLPREADLISIAGDRCLRAADRIQLLQDLAQGQEQLRRLAGRMVQVEEMERRRISRELHDDAGQALVVIRLQLEMVELSLAEDSEARLRLADVRELTEKTIIQMRRLISDLSPAVLEQLGLGAAVRQLVNRFRNSYPAKVKATLKIKELEPKIEVAVYRLMQECLINIAKHSAADNVNISITTADRVLRLHVEDDGVGFDVKEGLHRKGCFGLIGLTERVSLLGGRCEIESNPANAGGSRARKVGTVIQIELPLPVEKNR